MASKCFSMSEHQKDQDAISGSDVAMRVLCTVTVTLLFFASCGERELDSPKGKDKPGEQSGVNEAQIPPRVPRLPPVFDLSKREHQFIEKAVREIGDMPKDYLTFPDLGKVKELNLSRGNLVDISSVHHMTNLIVLTINGNFIYDITPLAGLTGLERLYLNNNMISDVSPLSKLSNLRILSLSGNQLINLNGLENLRNLEILNLKQNPVSERTVGELQKKIKDCTIMYAPTQEDELKESDSSARRGVLPEMLDKDKLEMAIRNICGKKTGELEYEDYKKVKGLPLYGLKIRDLSALAKLGELRILDLSNNEIRNLKPLHKMEKLQLLVLLKNPYLPKAEVDELKKILPNCEFIYKAK